MNLTSKSVLLFCAVYLYAFAIPFSAAGQHIVSGVASACLLTFLGLNYKILNFRFAWQNTRLHFILMTSLLLSFALANLLNPHGTTHPLHFMGGYGTFWVLPYLMTLAAPLVDSHNLKKHMLQSLVLVAFFLGLTAFSQMIWPWKLMGLHFEIDQPRARAFYSHPLSFAYMAGILFTFFFSLLLSVKKNRSILCASVAMGFCLFASNSKTMQAVVILTSVFLIYQKLKIRRKFLILLGMIFCLGVLFGTRNPFSQKFHNVLFHNPDLQSHYTDDRLAFWQVHWDMFLERPVLGHGTNITGEYRKPFYEKAQLGYMTKQYEAHNQYLQMAVEVGTLGFLIYLSWLLSWLRFFSKKTSPFAAAFLASFTVLLIAGLTQNAFQDAIVRYTLMILLVFSAILAGSDDKSLDIGT